MTIGNSVRHVALSLVSIAMMAIAAIAQEAAPPSPSMLSETYGAWTVQCVNATEGDQPGRACQMSQELLQQETRQRVLLFALSMEGEAARATLVMPFGLLLSDGVRLELAETELLSGTFRTCLPAGCIVEIDVPATAIEQLQTGENVTVAMTSMAEQPVRTDMSLEGFTAAYQRLVALSQGS